MLPLSWPSDEFQIVPTALDVLKEVYGNIPEKQKGVMVPPLGIGLQLIDWTDPLKSV